MKLTKKHEKKIFSQFGEDGIIETIFNKIGTTNKRFIEIGIEDGRECNTRNLIEKYGWKGTMIECDKRGSKKANKFYKNYSVKVIHDFITPSNINKYSNKKLDLFSIDIDGNDYWVLEKMKSLPRVMIIEYNCTLFNKFLVSDILFNKSPKKHPFWLYYGAGLNALIKLGKKKGYKLVYANGTNAFFIRKDIKGIKELPFKEGYQENLGRRRWGTPLQQFKLIKNFPFIEV